VYFEIIMVLDDITSSRLSNASQSLQQIGLDKNVFLGAS
jgi:hypothetical protein